MRCSMLISHMIETGPAISHAKSNITIYSKNSVGVGVEKAQIHKCVLCGQCSLCEISI